MIRAVLGLDVSTTGTGVGALPMNYAKTKDPWSRVIRAHFGTPLQVCSTEDEIAARIDGIAFEVSRFVASWATEYEFIGAVFEQYTFGRGNEARSRQVAEVCGTLKRELYRMGIPIYAVPASSARKLLLGANPTKTSVGRVAKEFVFDVVKLMGGPFETHDEADAYVVANWLVSELGGAAFAMSREQVGGMFRR